jgi:hypothetical protein
MSSFLDKQADKLATRPSRRGFMRLATKVTAAVAGLGFGMSRVRDAAACTYACCDLREPCFCSTCPSCPAGAGLSVYSWFCCQGGCQYRCRECNYTDFTKNCSCATRLVNGICGGCPTLAAG